MTNELTITPKNERFTLEPKNFDEAMKVSSILAKSFIVPKNYQGKPEDIFVAILWGAELGLKPIQSLQNIAVINGKPAMYGDALLSLVRSHPEFEWIEETVENGVATCKIKRKNQPVVVRSFSEEDAKRANLLGKPGPWTQYKNRMLQLRSRGFGLRDAFSDALNGLITREEAEDYPIDVTPATTATPAVENNVEEILGDALLSLVRSHPEFEWIEETVENGVATCKIKRKNQPVVVRSFSEEDAKRANLLGKPGPWTQYKNRMLQLRSRGFGLRDAFSDALNGLITREEAEDYPIDVIPATTATPAVKEIYENHIESVKDRIDYVKEKPTKSYKIDGDNLPAQEVFILIQQKLAICSSKDVYNEKFLPFINNNKSEIERFKSENLDLSEKLKTTLSFVLKKFQTHTPTVENNIEEILDDEIPE